MMTRRSRGQKQGFTPKQLGVLRTKLAGDLLQTALLNVAVDSMLRSSDLLRLTPAILLDAVGHVRETFVTDMQKEGGRTVTCSLTPKARAAVAAYVALAQTAAEEPLFPFCQRTLQRMVKGWAGMLGLDPACYSSHSLRRTKAAIVYARTKDIANVQHMLGHKWITSTQAYVGANVDSACALALAHDV